MANSSIEQMYARCMRGEATAEEQAELLALLSAPANEADATALLARAFAEPKAMVDVPEPVALEILEAIFAADKGLREPKAPVHRLWLRWVAAAVLLAGIATAATWWLKQDKTNPPVITQNKADIAPGGNKAILTLSGGQQVILDSANAGTVATQNGAAVVKLADGQLAYHAAGDASDVVTYNTLSTPRGGQYYVQLPDGTKVWLNAASSITYPTSFTGKERKVTLTGEAYFEVKHDAAHPFTVTYKDGEVHDLGTGFNIMSYADEAYSQATLAEGSMAVNALQQVKVLTPGNAAYIQQDQLQVKKVNLDEVTAWKNGQINFTNADLATVMRQVSRWYDVTIVYTGKVPQKRFFGLVDRNVKLSVILEFLQQNGIHTKLENKVISIHE